MLVGGILVQEGLHRRGRAVGELEAEVLVGAPHGSHLVLDEVLEVEVDDLALGQAPGLAVGDGVVVALGQRLGVVAGHLGQADRVAGEAPQRRHQAADRDQHAHRVAMGLDEQRVRVLAVDVLEVPDVLRRLERPAHPRCLPLEHLQEAAVPGERRARVVLGDPAVVARDVELGLEDHRGEVVRGDRHALLGSLGAHRVHRLERGNQLVDPVEVGLHLRDARVVTETFQGAAELRATDAVLKL